MNDAVARVIAERAGLERGFGGSVMVSGLAHLLAVGIALGAALIGPQEPVIRVVPGFAVALPPGGGGSPTAQPAGPARPAPPVTQPPAARAEPPPKIIKPPKEEPRKGLPDPAAKPTRRRPEPAPAAGAGASARGAPATPGFSLGPPGPGVPGGTDPFGDWYLAGVQRKIWMLWAQTVKAGMSQPVVVAFTIHGDGSVGEVRVEQSSGVYLIDAAAQRAILSSAPFGPLPRDYGTNRITIQGIFKPGE